jgi:hypothetical protein
VGTKKVVDGAYIVVDEQEGFTVEKIGVRKYTLEESGELRPVSNVGDTPFPRGKNIERLRDADRQSNQLVVDF